MALTKIKSGIAANTFVTDRLGYTPLNKAGDTPTSMMDLSNGCRIGGMYYYRKLCDNGSVNANTTFNLLAFSRYYWGACHIELMIRRVYYDAADYAHYVIQGHTRYGAYGPGLTMTGIRTTTNINAPTSTSITYASGGAGDIGWSTIQITLPTYAKYEVVIVADSIPSGPSIINTANPNTWVLL